MRKRFLNIILFTILMIMCVLPCGAQAVGNKNNEYLEILESIEYCQLGKDTMSTIAQLVRQLGEEEDSPLILLAKEYWHGFHNEYIELNEQKLIIEQEIKQEINQEDITIIAKIMWGEARGIISDTEVAAIGWCILNRVDANYGNNIAQVALAPHQFCYSNSFPVIDRFYYLAEDVIFRWKLEKIGDIDIGRILPSDYLWYSGDGEHNWFRDKFKGGDIWDFSYESPYST